MVRDFKYPNSLDSGNHIPHFSKNRKINEWFPLLLYWATNSLKFLLPSNQKIPKPAWIPLIVKCVLHFGTNIHLFKMSFINDLITIYYNITCTWYPNQFSRWNFPISWTTFSCTLYKKKVDQPCRFVDRILFSFIETIIMESSRQENSLLKKPKLTCFK